MILLRHGQSEFNVHIAATRRDPGLTDPALTEFGHVQAQTISATMINLGIRHIISSPYRRALQTVAPIARALGLSVLVQPLVRERYAFACDIGSERCELIRSWPEVDFSGIDEIWWPAIEEPASSIVGRALLFRAEMAELSDWSDTLVVSHWGFILCMTGRSVGNCEWLRCDPTEAPPEQIAWRP